jgi:hypothetical protein
MRQYKNSHVLLVDAIEYEKDNRDDRLKQSVKVLEHW